MSNDYTGINTIVVKLVINLILLDVLGFVMFSE